MEDYEGPSRVMMPIRHRAGLSAASQKKKEDTQFATLPSPITDAMDGFVTITPHDKGIYIIPPTTDILADEPYRAIAVYVAIPQVSEVLKKGMLDAGNYTMDEIKAVLKLHGVPIPSSVKRKADYVDLARTSGVVSNL